MPPSCALEPQAAQHIAQAAETLQSVRDLPSYPRVAGKLPRAVWLVSAISLCERFCYYGFIGPLRKFAIGNLGAMETNSSLENYIQNSRHDPLRPGALGLGESVASLMINIFLAMSYATPMCSAVIADSYLGRARTLYISFW